jgi:hypothetical protein
MEKFGRWVEEEEDGMGKTKTSDFDLAQITTVVM